MTVYGRRAAYYTDNHEDALVMWSRSLRDPGYIAVISELRSMLMLRLPEIDVPEFLPPLSSDALEFQDEPPHV